MNLSIVIPIKDERDNIPRLHDRLTQALASLAQTYEIVFVDDGSVDGSYAALEEIARRDSAVKVVRLRRNFGQSAALQAGIDWSQGDVVVTMDGDMQNDPADIPMLLERLKEGYDAVLGLRAKRQDHMLIRKIPSFLGNWLIRKVTGVRIKDMGCTLRAMRRELADSLLLYGEMHRFIPVLAQQSGAKLLQVPVRHHPRAAGKTKYTLSRTFRVFLDLITVKFLHSYLTRPMHVMGLAGLCSMFLGFLSLVLTVWMKAQFRTNMTGNPFLLLSAILVVIGVQFISLGLIGELMTRTYFESQGKRSYAVRNTLNIETAMRQKAA
ncbi:MAG: glycosyltransferase family 2 protein [Planctomycetes bacterium]|nr:glycosyltransferase family 2 protein [Planctomycetota bacterium]